MKAIVDERDELYTKIEKLRRAESALRETIFQLLTIIGTLPDCLRLNLCHVSVVM